MEQDPKSIGRIGELDLHSRETKIPQDLPFRESAPDISPDGRWVAYQVFHRTPTNRNEIYVRPISGQGMRRQVSNDGGDTPIWSRDGKQIFYRRGSEMWVVDVKTEGEFSSGRPRLLFERAGYGAASPIRSHDLSHDGTRFLMSKFEPQEPRTFSKMALVINWFEDLKRLSPPVE